MTHTLETTYLKAIGTKSETFDEERHSESRLVVWEMKRLRSDYHRLKQSLIRLTSCDELLIDNYISSLQTFVGTNERQRHLTDFKISKDFLKIENTNYDLSNEALDNLRKSVAESILFLERQSRDSS